MDLSTPKSLKNFIHGGCCNVILLTASFSSHVTRTGVTSALTARLTLLLPVEDTQ
jgi:hypothetical protein